MLDELDLFDDRTRMGRPRRHRRRKSGAGRSLFTFLLTLVILGALGVGGWIGFQRVGDMLAPPDFDGPGHGKVVVVIKTGDYAAQVGNELFRKGVVKSAAAFVAAAEADERSRELQPGAYQLKKEMRATAALDALLDPDNKVVDRVTVPEGQSNARTYRALSKHLDLPLAEFQKLDKDPESFGIDASWFTRSDKKKVYKSLEGFLYPSTYEFDPGTTASQAVQQMVDKFLAVAQEIDLQAVAEKKGITPYEAVIVASLGEAEVIPKDLPKVSRVIYNRLNHDEAWANKLQFDSTTNYWLEKQGKKRKDSSGLSFAELNDPKNPYSTHAYAGLPPGPIGNPSQSALEAAVNPAKGNWIFFVVTEQDGSSAFAATLAAHNRNVAICKQRDLGC
jgi:UPF0755 protein